MIKQKHAMIDACNKRIYEKRFIHSFLLASKNNAHLKNTHTHTTWHKHTFNILKSPRWNCEILQLVGASFSAETRLTGNHRLGTWQTAQTKLPPMCLVRLVQRLDLNALLLVIQFSHLLHLPNSQNSPPEIWKICTSQIGAFPQKWLGWE